MAEASAEENEREIIITTRLKAYATVLCYLMDIAQAHEEDEQVQVPPPRMHLQSLLKKEVAQISSLYHLVKFSYAEERQRCCSCECGVIIKRTACTAAALCENINCSQQEKEVR